MATYLGFLRAINLGPNRKFPKGDIVAATEAAGFKEVATHINTGNVRFHTAMRSRARIEEALEAAYLADRGFEVPTIVFRPDELCAIADEAEEIADGHPGTHYVSLLKQEPPAALVRQMEALSTDRDIARVRGRAVHLVITDPYHQAKLTNVEIEKQLGVATNRNLTVIRAIAEKWCR
jgi:uncharacterized protein (DUF1697 family)